MNVLCSSEHNTNNIVEKREKRPLLYHQCVDLMNFYIGFNNWSLGVKTKKLELTGSTFTATCTGKGPTVCKLPPFGQTLHVTEREREAAPLLHFIL